MSRGVLAIFGPTKHTSINTLTSLTDFYNIPYISWSFLGRGKPSMTKEKVRKFRNSNCKHNAVSFEPIVRTPRSAAFDKHDHELQDEYGANDDILTNDFTDFTSEEETPSQIYLRPDTYSVIIELIKFYKWPNIYYIYNHDHGRH